jgi:PAS domain-containing protein
MLAGGEKFELDYRLMSAVRGLRMLHAIARPDPEARGCYRGTLQDVTARHESEQALRESRQALRERTDALAAVIDSAPIGMAVTLPGGRFEHVNQALCELLGYSQRVRRPSHLSNPRNAKWSPSEVCSELKVISRRVTKNGQPIPKTAT